ncbi:MAG TPA: DUF2336 domain-containing protein [Bauldia sp.]|nr:DUF2336 domain-containing protein [Bauldia sp.]
MPIPTKTSPVDLARLNEQKRDAALMRATTELFVLDVVHDRDELNRFEELALHFLPKVTSEDRVFVAERLALAGDAPVAVVRMLARDVIAVAAPVLKHSTVLNSVDLLSIIAATGVEHHRLIARRAGLSPEVKRALRLTGDAAVLARIDAAATPRLPDPAIREAGINAVAAAIAPPAMPVPPSRPVSAPAIPAPPRPVAPPANQPAAAVAPAAAPVAGFYYSNRLDPWRFLSLDRKARLKLIADIAARPPALTHGSKAARVDRAFRSILSAAQIVGFARSGQIEPIVEAIGGGLGLSRQLVHAAIADKSGELFAVMLKALRLDDTQARQVFLLASPLGRDVQSFFPLSDLYAGMEPEVAETLVEAWREAATTAPSGHEAHMADSGTFRRSSPSDAVRPAEQRDERARRA